MRSSCFSSFVWSPVAGARCKTIATRIGYDAVIRRDVIEGILVVRIGSEVDVANASLVQRYLDEVVAEATTLVLSLEECSYIDSSGLLPILRLADRLGAGFYLVAPLRTQVRRICDLTGLGTRLGVCDTLDDALALANGKRCIA